MENWYQWIQGVTERYLTWRQRRKWKHKKALEKKNQILDWIEAFLWAAVVVLLINQYLFQAYMIPSGSMKNTLLETDRIFVNKILYGPELLPGHFKIEGFMIPKRSDIIIFENPEYRSRGPVFDIMQRIIYMVTLTLVDIDREPSGAPAHHFLIKRAAAVGGDRVRFRDGRLFFRPAGETTWYDEKTMFAEAHGPKIIFNKDDATRESECAMIAAGVKTSWMSRSGYSSNPEDPEKYFAYDKATWQIRPFDRYASDRFNKQRVGVYVPEKHILPLGDNRDNSKDGRYFGMLHEDKILGKAMFKFWPWQRIGSIE